MRVKRTTCNVSKISDEQKNDVLWYATFKKNMENEDAVELLNSREEVDAYLWCVEIIKGYSVSYSYAEVSAPKNKTRRAKEFEKTLNQCKKEQAKEDEITYMHQMEPLTSQRKVIYAQAKADIKSVMFDAGIGQDRRKLLGPMLMKLLIMPEDVADLPEITQLLKRISEN